MHWIFDTLIALLSGGFGGLGFGGGWILYAYVLGFGIADRAQARGLVLLLFIPCAIASLVGHIKNGLVDAVSVKWAAPIAVAVFAGGYFLSGVLPDKFLRIIMTLGLAFLGGRELKKGLEA